MVTSTMLHAHYFRTDSGTSIIVNAAGICEMTSSSAAAVAGPVQNLDFQTLLNNLPRELYDQIRELTFEAIGEAMASGTEDCNFACEDGRTRYAVNLKILHLNQALRERYAEDFYRRRTFTFELAEKPRSRHQTLEWVKQWLRLVPEEQRRVIGKLVLAYPWCCGNGVGRLTMRRRAAAFTARNDVLYEFGRNLANKLFCNFPTGDDWNWEKGFWGELVRCKG